MSECDHCAHKPTLRDNIKHHKYLMCDDLELGCDQCEHGDMKYRCDQCDFDSTQLSLKGLALEFLISALCYKKRAK